MTAAWAIIQKNKRRSGSVIFTILVFAAGWQVGKLTSMYANSTPIVFEDRQCSEFSSSGGTAEELTALKEAGEKKNNETVVGERTTPIATQSEVAGVTVSEEATTAEQKKFVGSVNSDLYHRPDCSSSKRIKEENQVWFASQEDAQASGYSPSKCTRDKLGI